MRERLAAGWSLPGVVLMAIAVIALIARVAVLRDPVVGFDEQFYLLVGDHMLHGQLPYIDIFDRKPIGLFLIYAASSAIGPDPYLQYKLVALVFVVATAFLLYRSALPRAGAFGALLAAAFYVFWLNFMEGEGGQSPVFYDLPVLIAAMQLLNGAKARDGLVRRGLIAMAVMGLAIQIKTSVVVEGAYFGAAFLFLAWRQAFGWVKLAGFAASMIALALMPTLIAMGFYAAIGHLDTFLFANFVSVFGQKKLAIGQQMNGVLALVGIFLPLVLIALLGLTRLKRGMGELDAQLLLGWLIIAVLAVVLYGRFASPHYAIPILLPLLLMLAPVFDAYRKTAIALAIVALVAGQAVVLGSVMVRGGRAEALAVAKAAQPRNGRCIFVYDGYPALYMLTHSCLPSRWVFPGHLNTMDEANSQALGADPVNIIRDILSRRPEAIIDTYPSYSRVNRETHALMMKVIRARYRLTACIATPRHKLRLVYREKGDAYPLDLKDCPPELMAQAAR